MDITVHELEKKMELGTQFVLIDVREPYEHAEFNIGGELIPLGQFPARIEDFEDQKNEEIILYCRSGRRSASAQAMMQAFGYTNVRNLIGGMLDWQEKIS